MKSKFIRTIGKASLNNYSFDVYENENGTAEIRVLKNGRKKLVRLFDDRKKLENWLELIFNNEVSIFETSESSADIQKLIEILV